MVKDSGSQSAQGAEQVREDGRTVTNVVSAIVFLLFFAGVAFVAADPSRPWGSTAIASFSFAVAVQTMSLVFREHIKHARAAIVHLASGIAFSASSLAAIASVVYESNRFNPLLAFVPLGAIMALFAFARLHARHAV